MFTARQIDTLKVLDVRTNALLFVCECRMSYNARLAFIRVNSNRNRSSLAVYIVCIFENVCSIRCLCLTAVSVYFTCTWNLFKLAMMYVLEKCIY